MRLEQRLNSLIRAGRNVIDSDFTVAALLEWKKEAGSCVDALLRPEDMDTERLEDLSTQNDQGKPTA
jgi:hypothetical protein